MLERKDVNREQVMMLGVSHGGMVGTAWLANHNANTANTTSKLAFNIKPNIGISSGFFYFNPNCPWSTSRLTDAYTEFGKKVTVQGIKSLMLYSDEDELFLPALTFKVAAAYSATGAPVRYVSLPKQGKEAIGSHFFYTFRSSISRWWPSVHQYLVEQKMPVSHRYAVEQLYTPKPSGYATITDINRLPVLEGAKAYWPGYHNFPTPKAAAVSENGNLYYESDEAVPIKKVFDTCQTKFKSPCKIYAIDSDVVYR